MNISDKFLTGVRSDRAGAFESEEGSEWEHRSLSNELLKVGADRKSSNQFGKRLVDDLREDRLEVMQMRKKVIVCMIAVGAIFGWSLLLFPALAQEEQLSDTTFKDEPPAHTLYDKMIEAMRYAETIYYESEYQWETKGNELGHSTYRLWMKKPNHARLEAASHDGRSKGILVGDGEYFWIYWPTGRPWFAGEDSIEYAKTCSTSYMKKRTPVGHHSIAHQTNLLGTGMSMTIIEPSIFHGYNDPMEPYLDGVRSMGIEKVDKEECDVIEVSFMDHQRSRYLYLSKRDHLPRKLKEVVRAARDVTKHELWANVTINREMPMDKFAWEPPDGWVEYRLPKIEEGLLKPGTEAPDFELNLVNRTKFKLSDCRGKLVWLVFWRVGCQPCRQEIPYLEQLYRKYRNKELVILGFDCSDDKRVALEFLQDNSVTFPNIVDSSDAAKKTCFEDYQRLKGMAAVPLNYIIDANGKVADAWYGYERGDERGMQAIEKIGVK